METTTYNKGIIGEDIACTFLIQKGFSVVSRNYRRKWGELDIVAQKEGTTHFFEVKTVYETLAASIRAGRRPEDNVDGFKVRQLRRIIETYLADEIGDTEVPFEFHVLCVYADPVSRRAHVKWLKNIVL